MKLTVVHLTQGGFSGGFRKYARMVLPELARSPRVSRLDVFDPPGGGAERIPGADHHSWPDGDWLRGFRELRTRVRALRPDVVFIPTARWIDTGVPTAVMVRNMLPLVSPVSGSARDVVVNLGRRRAALRAVRRAERVIAVSTHVQRFLTTRWRIDPEKVRVIYHGSQHVEPSPAPPALLRGLARQDFLFAAGSLFPYRGLEDLVQAVARLTRDGRPPHVVVAGEAPPSAGAYLHRMQKLAAELGVGDRIVWAGRLGAEDMAWCFRACRAFVMTSRVEACPNLVLEAMGHGALSISTTTQPMPEFYAECAFYYPAGDFETLASRIAAVLSIGGGERAALSKAARLRAELFSWQRTAAATLDLLTETHAGGWTPDTPIPRMTSTTRP